MIDIKLTKICVGNKFKQGYITSIISPTEIVIDNGESINFESLEPIKFSAEILKEYGYSIDNKIHNFLKIFVLENPIEVYGETYEPGIYLADLKNNISSNRIKFEHEFQNIESMLIDYNMPFNNIN